VDVAVGSAVNSSIAADGGTTPYAFSATGLPDGLTLSATGVLSGTAPAAGTYPLTVEVTDAVGGSATGTVTLTVA
jgi:5'-nucleotidase